MKKLQELLFAIILLILAILGPILIISFLFFTDIILIIIKHLIKYGYVDWNIVLFWSHGKYNKHEYYASLGDESISRLKSVIFIIIICLISVIKDRKAKKKQINKISSIINDDIPQYYDEFISKFNDTIDHFPNNSDMNKFVKPAKIKLLKILILQKIQLLHDMTLSQKYKLFVTNNTQIINIGNPLSYGIRDNFEINLLLSEIQAPKYISLKILFPKEVQDNIININYYKNENEYNNNLVLQLVFDQYLIIKNIILQVFLNQDIDNEYIKYDVINQIKNYKKNNNTTKANYNKVQILISAIRENVNENVEFEKKFFEALQNSNILENIDNNIM